jgi:hypothetical protein
MGLDFQTHGEVVPSVELIRARMEREGFQMTNVFDAEKCVESFDHIAHRRPLTYGIKRDIAAVKTAVKAGKYVHVCIHYGKFNERMRAIGKHTGDPVFAGGHSVGVLGERQNGDHEVEWLLHDPLDDRRRPSIPQGPRWVPRSVIVAAMEAFAGGEGQCYAGVFGGGQRR